mgnify:CR=1 FL=1
MVKEGKNNKTKIITVVVTIAILFVLLVYSMVAVYFKDRFLFGTKVNKPFMVLYSLVAIVGATMDLGLMWNIAETFNGLMAIPNLIAVFLLSGVVVKLVKEYFAGEGKNA